MGPCCLSGTGELAPSPVFTCITPTHTLNTVEPLNNGHIGTDPFVHYREVVLFLLSLYRLVYRKVSFIQSVGSTVYKATHTHFSLSLPYQMLSDAQHRLDCALSLQYTLPAETYLMTPHHVVVRVSTFAVLRYFISSFCNLQ